MSGLTNKLAGRHTALDPRWRQHEGAAADGGQKFGLSTDNQRE